MIITFEGIDGSGKSTQLRLLKDRLTGNGKSVFTISFPQYGITEYARMIEHYLSGRAGKHSPMFIAYLYACDRLESLKALRTMQERKDFVLIDRYVASNKAYQAARLPHNERKEFLAWVDSTEYEKHVLPPPDKVLYLDMPVGYSQGLLKQRSSIDIHESNSDYLSECRLIYLELAKQDKWVTVDCVGESGVLSVDEIHEDIWGKLGLTALV